MSHEESVISAIKTALPAVVSIVIGKNADAVAGDIPDEMWHDLEEAAKEEKAPASREEIVSHMPKTKSGKVRVGWGSGFLVSKDGHVMTNKHVVVDPDAEYSVTTAAEDTYTAKVLARDPLNDVAILKIEGDALPYITLGDSNKICMGQTAIALGNALGEFQNTVSAGIVSGLSRFLTAVSDDGEHAEHLRGLIQTDAAINPGNSGGPLVNMDGQVVGINTAMIMGAQNIGFAIPVNYAKKDLEEVKKYGKIIMPFLGVKYVLLSKEMAEANKLPVNDGALVVREALGEPPVIKGSAADIAGIKEWDIILECNGQKITAKNPLAHILQKCKIGEETSFKILRDKKEINLKAKLEEKV